MARSPAESCERQETPDPVPSAFCRNSFPRGDFETLKLFLGSCLLSYLALRSIRAERSLALEQAADLVFLAGLGMMVVVCALVAYELI